MSKTFKAENITALLYSKSQNCFHIEPLQEYIISQYKSYIIGGNLQGYQLIGVFESIEEANDWTEKYYNWKKRAFIKTNNAVVKLINL